MKTRDNWVILELRFSSKITHIVTPWGAKIKKMPETVEYGLPPEDKLRQRKVQELFKNTWDRLNRIHGDSPPDRNKIEKEVQLLMEHLACLHIELPCQGVEYRGVVVDRDSEIPQDIPPAPFIKWGKALGVPSDLFENKRS